MNMKKYIGVLIIMAVVITGCEIDERKIISEKHENLKFGFTTQNFISTKPVSVDNAKRFIKYASEQGFSWIELRDPDASLSLEQCKIIAAFAVRNDIEVNYTVQR